MVISRLGKISSSIKDCFVAALDLDGAAHSEKRAEYRKNHFQFTLKVENLSYSKLLDFNKTHFRSFSLSDLHSDDQKSISYYSAKSILSDSDYFLMSILQKISPNRCEIECICYSNDTIGAEHIIKELTAAFSDTILHLGGKLV